MLTNWERSIRILKPYVLLIKETFKWLKNKISSSNNIKVIYVFIKFRVSIICVTEQKRDDETITGWAGKKATTEIKIEWKKCYSCCANVA